MGAKTKVIERQKDCHMRKTNNSKNIILFISF